MMFAGLVALAAAAMAPAAEYVPFTPLPRIRELPEAVIVARTRNLLTTLDTFSRSADAVMPGMGMQIKMQALAAIFNDPTGAVLSPDLPSALLLANPKRYEQAGVPPVAGIVGASQAAQLLANFTRLAGGDTAAILGNAIALPDQNLFLKVVERYVVLASSQPLLDDVAAALAANSQLIASLPPGADLEMFVDLKKLYDIYRTDIEKGIEDVSRQLADPMQLAQQMGALGARFAGVLPLAAPIIKMLPETLTQFDGLRVSIELKPEIASGGFVITTELYPARDSRLQNIIVDTLRPLDRPAADRLAGRLPEGSIVLAGTSCMDEVIRLFKNISSRLTAAAEVAGVPNDALITLIFDKLPSFVPTAPYTAVGSMISGDNAMDMASVWTPPLLTKDKTKAYYQEVNEALAASQLYRTLAMLAQNAGQPVLRGFQVQEIAGADGISAVMDYGGALDPMAMQRLQTMLGDPPALHLLYAGDTGYMYQGPGGVAAAKRLLTGTPRKPLAAASAYRRLFNNPPKGTTVVASVRLLSVICLGLQQQAAGPMAGMFASIASALQNFRAGDEPLELHVFRNAGVAGCRTFIPIRTIGNLVAAMQAVQMQMMSGGRPQPFEQPAEEDLPF